MHNKIKPDKLSSAPSSFTTVVYYKSSNNLLSSMSSVCKHWASPWSSAYTFYIWCGQLEKLLLPSLHSRNFKLPYELLTENCSVFLLKKRKKIQYLFQNIFRSSAKWFKNKHMVCEFFYDGNCQNILKDE